MKNIIAILICTLSLTACSSQYIMSTNDGKLITTESKPKLDADADMYYYYDSEGKEVMIQKDEITQIIER